MDELESFEDALKAEGDVECVVHAEGFFEAACAYEACACFVSVDENKGMKLNFVPVSWSCDPADAVRCVVLDAFHGLVRREEAKTVIVDEEAGCTAVACVGLHCCFEGSEGGCAAMD